MVLNQSVKWFQGDMIDISRPFYRYLRFSVIEKRYWPLIEKYRLIDSINLADLLQFSTRFLQEGFVQSLVIGNFTPEVGHWCYQFAVYLIWSVTTKHFDNPAVYYIGLDLSKCLGLLYFQKVISLRYNEF